MPGREPASHLPATVLARHRPSKDWYESKRSGLGNEFLDVAEAAINHILEFPESYAKLRRDIRRYHVRQFHHHLLYAVDDAWIFFVGFVHHSRDVDRILRERTRP
ncbi:MAG: type II toxin-antitoxin system RelE/ParE family toxin [Planctomycetes bacterium]|nr:type II toxin-antitoxin system RelE/ParE family toxin [Planctomycetota bacterium]